MSEERARAPRETAEGRPEATQERRKNRETPTSRDPTARRFGVSDDFFDQDKYAYRAALDEGTRLYELTVRDDYEFVTAEGKPLASTDGQPSETALKYRAGNKVDGSPQYSYLLRKPLKFATEDRKAKDAKIDAEEEARLRRPPGDAPDHSYTPKR